MDFDINELLQLLSQPGMAQALAEMSTYGDRGAMLREETQRAEAMRGTPGARGIQTSGTYVASSPLEHMAVGLRRYQGERDLANARRQQESLVANDATTRTRLGSAMAEAMRKARLQRASNQYVDQYDESGEYPGVGFVPGVL